MAAAFIGPLVAISIGRNGCSLPVRSVQFLLLDCGRPSSLSGTDSLPVVLRGLNGLGLDVEFCPSFL
jgi:hypothetical protein